MIARSAPRSAEKCSRRRLRLWGWAMLAVPSALTTTWLSACSSTRPAQPREVETHVIDVSDSRRGSGADSISARSGASGDNSTEDASADAKKGVGQPDRNAANANAAGATMHSGKAAPSAPKSSSQAKAAKPKDDGAPKSTEPLIMENADHLEGFRSRGEYILTGQVRFRHGELRFFTERAVWSKEQNQVYCEQGMRILHRGSELTSDRGRYSKARNEAEAEGQVTFRDSSGEIRGRGQRLTYNRVTHDVFFNGAPEIRRLYFDSLPGRKGRDTSKVNDTLLLQAYRMQYNDSTQVAVAESSVFITKRKTQITCRRAEYRDKTDSLFLTGEPKVLVDRSRIQGDKMRMKVFNEEIRGLLVQGGAKANSTEPKTDSTPERQSEVRGDSLQIVFAGKNIDSVQVFRQTEGLYFDTPRPQLKNRMQGDRMVMRFKKKEVQSAQVVGGAKSTYYHLDGNRLQGRNVAQGDTIRFAFEKGEVDEVLVTGNAKGTYYGRAKKAKPAQEGGKQ